MNRIKLARFLIMAMAAALIFTGTTAADLTDDLVSYWPLDGNFADVQSGNDGILRGSDLDPVFEDGQLGQGILLDGIDQFVEITGDESQFDFVDQDFSISAWFRVDSWDKSWQALIAKGEGNRWRVHRRGAENTMTWNGGNADVPAYFPEDFDLEPADDGELHHFVGVSRFDDGLVEMYIDGQFVSEGPPPVVENNNMPVMIGENPDARGRTWNGLIDDVAIWGRALDEDEVTAIWNDGDGMVIKEVNEIPPIFIGGEDVIGSRSFRGSRSNQMYTEVGDPESGLLQEWFEAGNPGNKNALDQVYEDQAPVVEPFRAGHGTTWWSGHQAPIGDLVQYPDEVQPPLNATNNDNYTVRATGEINIPESGTYRFTDGVDDYTYLAIDLDNSGVAGDDPDEVLIDDNSWTNVLRDGNDGVGLAEVDIDVADGGGWLAIEFNMAEGGGGDAGVVYWDYDPDAPEGDRLGGQEGFPEFSSDILDIVDAENMYIPDTHLRSVKRDLISADLTATVTADRPMEFDVNGDTDEADQLVLDNPDPNVFTTRLDVDGITFQIKGAGAIASGDAFTIIDADNVLGVPIITSADPAQTWVFDAATGRVCLDSCPGVGGNGDYNGDGVLDAADIDLQAAEMKAANPDLAKFDHNSDGVVNSADRTIWVKDLKGTWIGDSNFDNEFNSGDLVGVFSAGKYETGAMAGWAEGDWDGDMVFGSGDLVAAFSDGGYEQGPPPAAAAVPEPSSLVLALLSAMGLIGVARRRNG